MKINDVNTFKDRLSVKVFLSNKKTEWIELWLEDESVLIIDYKFYKEKILGTEITRLRSDQINIDMLDKYLIQTANIQDRCIYDSYYIIKKISIYKMENNIFYRLYYRIDNNLKSEYDSFWNNDNDKYSENIYSNVSEEEKDILTMFGTPHLMNIIDKIENIIQEKEK